MLIIAVALVGGAVLVSKRDEQTITEARTVVKKIDTKVTSGTVEKIEIKTATDPLVTLYQRNNKWYTDPTKDHQVVNGAMTSVFTPLDKPIEGSVVSDKPESFKDYEVSDDTATRVRFFTGGKSQPEFDIFIGKNGPAPFSTYIREAGSNDVLNVNTGLANTFKRSDGWRDKTVFNFPSNHATRIEAKGTSTSYVLAKKDGKWFFEDPAFGEAQDARVNSIISMFGNYSTGSFPETTATLAQLGLEPAKDTITVTYDDTATSPSESKKMTLLIGDKIGTTTDHYAKRADSDEIYTITETLINAILPADLHTVAVNPPAPPEPPAQTNETTTTATLSAPETHQETTPTLHTTDPSTTETTHSH